MKKVIRAFIYLAGALLAVTAIAKLVSATGRTVILEKPDPILVMPFRYVFYVVGATELAIATFCFIGKRIETQVCVIAWLATTFVLYRIGLFLVHYQKPCACLGNLTDALHIQPQTANIGMKIVLAFLIGGSYSALFWFWREKQKGRLITTSKVAVELSQPKNLANG